MTDYKTSVESNHFIVLSHCERDCTAHECYQRKNGLEKELIQNMRNQGYEYAACLPPHTALLANDQCQ